MLVLATMSLALPSVLHASDLGEDEASVLVMSRLHIYTFTMFPHQQDSEKNNSQSIARCKKTATAEEGYVKNTQ